MCIGVPGLIISVEGADAVVDFAGMARPISLLTLPDARPGDWIIAHSGFAVKRVSEAEATQSIDCIGEMVELQESHRTD